MHKNQLQTVYVKIDEIKTAEYNPRQWNDKQFRDLKESIKKFGFIDPVICNNAEDRKNILVGGHFRVAVAKELKIEEIPVVYINIPNIEKEKELNLRLNKNQGEWNFDLLKEFDLNLLMDVGFGENELSDIWDDLVQVEDDVFDVEEELKDLKEITVKEGDLYQLGNHRLICGDSLDLAVVKRLVNDEKIDAAYCDSPYNINLDYNKGVGTKGKYGGTKVHDNKSDEEYEEFLRQSIKNAIAVSKDDAHFFYWCDEKYIGLVQSLYKEFGITNKRVCLWIKNNSSCTPKVAFNKVYEPCVYGVKGKPYLNKNIAGYNEVLNQELSTGGRLLDDILDLFNIWLVKRLPSGDYEHPTQKPVTLHEKPLKRCTKANDNVLDLFGGSGSTLLACEQLGRKAFLAELDPIFCTLILNRYEKHTGQKPKKLN